MVDERAAFGAAMNRRGFLGEVAATLLATAAPALLVAGDSEVVDPSNPGRFGLAPPRPRTILGVHTRLTDEVEAWKIARTVDMVRQMGAGWIVELFPWAYIEPRRGEFDWTHPDEVIRDANRQGLEVIARLDFVPAWARPPGSTPRLLPYDRFVDYANFAARFAARYQHAVRYFVVWNEPNTSFEWGYRGVSPRAYVALLREAATAIRGVHPDAKVLAAGLAPTLDRSELALDDLEFLRGMYAHGAAAYFDGLAAHTYGWKFPPDSLARADRLNFARVELLRAVMERNGDGAKPIIVTESGWNDSPRWTKSVHPGQRVAYTLRALEKATVDYPWLQALCLWAFRLPAPSHDYNDYFTLVDPSFRPKPIYNAIQARAGAFVRPS